MKPFFIYILLFCTVLSVKAQLQPWSVTDIENAGWTAAYKQEKVKKVSIYISDEYNKIDNAKEPEEVRIYNENGHLVTMSRYKYNWSKKVSERVSLDSFFFSPEGMLIRYRSYDPSAGYLRLYKEGFITNNAKGQPVKQEYFYRSNEGTMVKEETATIVYDAAGKPVRMNSSNIAKVLSYSKAFTTDATGKITRTIKKDDGGMRVTEEYILSKSAVLERYRELYGKDINKAITYTYDDKGRRIGRRAEGHTDNTTYSYVGDSRLPSHVATEYEGLNGKTDIRHAHRQYVYEYF